MKFEEPSGRAWVCRLRSEERSLLLGSDWVCWAVTVRLKDGECYSTYFSLGFASLLDCARMMPGTTELLKLLKEFFYVSFKSPLEQQLSFCSFPDP